MTHRVWIELVFFIGQFNRIVASKRAPQPVLRSGEMTINSSERRTVRVRRVDQCESLAELFEHSLPAFGGAYLRRIYQILDRAIGRGCTISMSIAGPVTVSGQHQAWLMPLLES